MRGLLSITFLSWKATEFLPIPIDTGRKLNVLCTFNLRHMSTGIFPITLTKLILEKLLILRN